MDTLLLDTALWDLVLDAHGNLAVASNPYSLAQDVASALRLFVGECYYDTTRGIRYFEDILAYAPPIDLLKSSLTNAALTVPEVVTAQAFVAVDDTRTVTGQVQCTTTTGPVVVTGPVTPGGAGPFAIQVTGIGLGAIP
jgi:hypothetical protein